MVEVQARSSLEDLWSVHAIPLLRNVFTKLCTQATLAMMRALLDISLSEYVLALT